MFDRLYKKNIISTHALTWSATGIMKSNSPRLIIFQLTRSRGARQTLDFTGFPRLFDFNSRAHVERDRTRDKTLKHKHHFNSRAHVERDRRGQPHFGGVKNFNSRAHVERDRKTAESAASQGHFNSRAHVERDLISLARKIWPSDFNSRAHVERD